MMTCPLYETTDTDSFAYYHSFGVIYLSPLRKLTNCIKWSILDEIFDFGNSVMPVRQLVGVTVRQLVGVTVRQLVGVTVRQLVGVTVHQWIEKMKNIAKSNIFGFVSFRSGLIFN